MKTLTFLLAMLNAMTIFPQDNYRDKNYDARILQYQEKTVDSLKLSKEEYLHLTKPFQKWDSRAVNFSEVWIMGKLAASKNLPNFLWGVMAKRFGLDINLTVDIPNIYIQKAWDNRLAYIDQYPEKKKALTDLAVLMKNTNKRIFVNDSGLKRIDNIFCENDRYWAYSIPPDSPFPMSDSIVALQDAAYTQQEKDILEKLAKLGLYAAYCDENAAYFIIGGVLDNSFGYLYPFGNAFIPDNHLFKKYKRLKMDPDFYFYLAN